ncbi:hypothetical protein VTK26DRAFT_5665 [Humicola hyalothermophila]
MIGDSKLLMLAQIPTLTLPDYPRLEMAAMPNQTRTFPEADNACRPAGDMCLERSYGSAFSSNHHQSVTVLRIRKHTSGDCSEMPFPLQDGQLRKKWKMITPLPRPLAAQLGDDSHFPRVTSTGRLFPPCRSWCHPTPKPNAGRETAFGLMTRLSPVLHPLLLDPDLRKVRS